MGPRPCGRGRHKYGALAASPGASFNGATALRPWTGLPRHGPVDQIDLLQWGHGLAAVDGCN